MNNEVIKAKVTEVKKLLEDVPSEKLCMLVRELEKAWDKLEQEAQEPWPKVGDEVTIVDLLGETVTQIYLHTLFFEHQLKIGNCHRTPEQALSHKEYITSPRVRARELVELLPGFDPKGRNAIFYDIDYGVKTIELVASLYGGISFTSHKAAMSAITNHEPLIKVALGVIVGDEAERIVREYVGRGE